MKILLITPPWFNDTVLDNLISKNPPLGLAYIAAVLERDGYTDIKIIDMRTSKISIDKIGDHISNFKPDIIGMYVTTGQVISATKIIEIIKSIDPKILCVVGGPHPSVLPEETLKETKTDIVVLGEGEITMLELVKAVEKKRPLNKVLGLYYKNNDKIIFTGRRPNIKDLDSLPFPARHLLPDISLYSDSHSIHESKIHAQVMSSRGCPFQCTFCDNSVYGNTIRTGSAKNTVDEIEFLVNKYPIKEIRFFDDLFTANKKRVIEICDELAKRNININWCCEARVTTVTPELLDIMKKGGCWAVSYGMESGSQEILDMLKKNIKLEEIERAVKWTKQAGLMVRGYFMIGLPGDNIETIKKTIKFAMKLKLDHVVFSLFSPYPGTEVYKNPDKYGVINAKKWDEYMSLGENPAFIPHGLTAKQLEKYYKRAYLLFYLRPRNILGIIKRIHSFSTFNQYLKAFLWTLKKSKLVKNE